MFLWVICWVKTGGKNSRVREIGDSKPSSLLVLTLSVIINRQKDRIFVIPLVSWIHITVPVFRVVQNSGVKKLELYLF